MSSVFFCSSQNFMMLQERPVKHAFPWRGRWHPASPASRMTDEVLPLLSVRCRSEAAAFHLIRLAPRGRSGQDTFPSKGKALCGVALGQQFRDIPLLCDSPRPPGRFGRLSGNRKARQKVPDFFGLGVAIFGAIWYNYQNREIIRICDRPAKAPCCLQRG